ncbi:MAG: T9SS type A sorting domain-containing protein, partial [Bacteroidota bacterium]
QSHLSGFNGSSNCHGFANAIMKRSWDDDFSSFAYWDLSCEEEEAINICATEGIMYASTFMGKLTEVSNSSSADIIIYEENYPGFGWTVDHSAVNIGGGYYISKWESGGPVVRHRDCGVPSSYYQPGKPQQFRIRYFSYDASQSNTSLPTCSGGGCTAPNLNIGSCIYCGCNYNNTFSFNATSGFTNHDWQVFGGTITNNYGYMIKVSKPGGGYITVTLTARDNCSDIQSTTRNYWVPPCSGPPYYIVNNNNHITVNLPVLTLEEGGKESSNNFKEIGEESTVALFSLGGQLLYKQSTPYEQLQLRLDRPLSPGIYVLKIDTPFGSYSEKLLIH